MKSKGFSTITEDVLIAVFTFLGPHEIVTLTECCRRTHSIAIQSDQFLWKPLADKVYLGKTFNVPRGNLLERIQRLSAEEIMSHLYDVNTSRCMILADYQQLLMIKSLFYLTFSCMPSSDCDWIRSLRQWKATYFYSIRDIKRSKIMLTELVHIAWLFQFKGMSNQIFSARFLNNFTLVCDFNNDPYNWKFVKNGFIQVDQYPPLKPSRLPSGAWKLENRYVILTQMEAVEVDLPLVDVYSEKK